MYNLIRKYLFRYEIAVIVLPVFLITVWPHLVKNLLTSTYMPHGHCYLWLPELVILHVSSDLVIGISYVFIAVALGYLVYKASSDIPFHKMFLAFGLFIISCGFTHVMSVINVYEAYYWLSGSVKIITAVASALTAVSIPFFIPRALELIRSAKISEERKEQIEKANKELEKLNSRLKELDVIKTEFFTNVSHELRTPLALILGPAEKVIADPATTDKTRKSVKIIQQNATSLLKHVNDLLDISKLEVGKMELKYSRIDMSELLRIAASYFESLADERSITLAVDAEEKIMVEADKEKIERVLINLLSNAFKFTPESGSISLRLHKEGDNVVCRVQDSGKGISQNSKEIFNRFNSVSGGLNVRLGSTGLGLSIVKQFIELHNGTITVENTEEGGARFIFSLPVKAPAGIKIHNSVDDEISYASVNYVMDLKNELYNGKNISDEEITAAGNEKSGKILIVEDNMELNRFISENLAEEDYFVYSAFDGEQGYNMAKEIKPDLILSDMLMPKVTGEELLDMLKKEPEMASVPIVLLTAKADEELKISLLRRGAQDYLNKPFTVAELKVRINNLVKTKIARDILQKELNSYSSDLSGLVEELTQRKRVIEYSLKEKETLLKEIHHRVKNNLQIISSLLNLQADYVKDQDALSVFNDSRDRIRSMALVHESLYQSKDLTEINFSEYIKDLTSYLVTMYKNNSGDVIFNCDCSDIYINIEKAVPLGLILNEIITNSLKHAFPEEYGNRKKEIKITLLPVEGKTELVVQDNGIGFKQNFDFGNSSSLGLLLIKTLIEQVDGEIKIIKDEGTGYKLRF